MLTNWRAAASRGKLGLSVDKFHGIHTAKAAEFCRVARRVFGRDNIVSLSYASRQPDQGLEPVRDLAARAGRGRGMVGPAATATCWCRRN